MNKLGFYLQNSQDSNGMWNAITRMKPPVILTHLEFKNDDLLKQMRDWRSPDTFVVGRLGMDNPEQNEFLDDPDPVAAGQRLADKVFNKDRSFLLKRYPDDSSGRLLVDAWMSLNECIPGPSWDDWPVKAAEKEDWEPNILVRHARYDILQVAFRNRMREYVPGVEAVAFNFGAGNFQNAQQYIDLYPETLKEYTYLGFHEYGWPVMSEHLADGPVKTDVGLFPTIMDGLQTVYGDHHKAIITESGLARAHLHKEGGDKGWLYEEETLTQESYWQSLEWYNNLMAANDTKVLGACLYQVGWMNEWKTFRLLGEDNDGNRIEIIDWIADRLVD